MITAIKKFFSNKLVMVGLMIAVQALILFYLLGRFANYEWVRAGMTLLSYIMVIYVINNDKNPSFKLAWVILILIVPVFGGVLYLMFGNKQIDSRLKSAVLRHPGIKQYLPQKDLPDMPEDQKRLFEYGYKSGAFPTYDNTEVTFCPIGEDKFAKMKEELEKAEHFIFMEYFIIRSGKMWDEIHEILVRKVKEGVTVKMLYDDIGCLGLVPNDFQQQLNNEGIEAYPFNEFKPQMVIQMNNRDHPKILVIDNKVGFVGGINLGDEYINVTHPHGHWKDTAVMLKGEAVWSLTVMFLQMLDYVRTDKSYTYAQFALPNDGYKSEGFVQPVCDSPTDEIDVGLSEHLNLISHAKKYVWIMTPYLIVGHEMITALCVAARSGIDVRMITPFVPDKVVIQQLTRSHYGPLLEAGVKIYEYTPGFVHSKTWIVDDEVAFCGTVNMDYRSYFHHFECGVLFADNQAVKDMAADYEETLKVSQEVTLAEYHSAPFLLKVFRAICNVFAPLC